MWPKGYSIWLVPGGDEYLELSDIIIKLSKVYSSPVFEPHITLLGGVCLDETEMIDKTTVLAKQIEPLLITFESIGSQDNYFRSLYLLAKPTRRLVKVNNLAQKIFKVDEDYMPHLSLIYSEFPITRKKQMIRLLTNYPRQCRIDRVSLYRAEGEVKDWRKVVEIKLSPEV